MTSGSSSKGSTAKGSVFQGALPASDFPALLTTAEDIRRLAEKLQQESIIAFDTEFIRETTFYPTVEIVQVATRSESWLIDVQAFRGGSQRKRPDRKSEAFAGLRPLLDVFENPKILKIVHAAQGDQECLWTSFEVVAKPCLDTAVAASLCGYGDGIGLAALLKAVLNVSLKKGHARTDWSARPLPEQLLEYAHADVQSLVGAAERLLEELDRLGRRAWAFDLCSKFEDPHLYDPSPEDLAQRLARGGRLDAKGYGVLVELMRWREERVKSLNLPRRWVADDAVLVDLAVVRPKDLNHLGTFRGLNKGEIKNSGEALLEAVKKGLAHPVPQPQRQGARLELPTTAESQVLDLLKCYIGILADRHRIAAKNLLTSSQLLGVLRREAKQASDLIGENLLTEGAAQLVGEEILAFLAGRRALSVQDGRIQIVEVGGSTSFVESGKTGG